MEPSFHIPDELISEILSRLPVKCVLRFRCVSKSWLSLISSPRFIRMHLGKSINSIDYTHHELILESTQRRAFKRCTVYSLLNEPFTSAVALDDYPSEGTRPILFNGSCNGLICVAAGVDLLILWNPATKRLKKLPILELNYDGDQFMSYGIGYDEANDDYKVVGIYCASPRSNGVLENQVKIYSSNSNSWRTMKNVPLPYGDPIGGAIFVNGKLHWQMNGFWHPNGCPISRNICVFDLETEIFGGMELPVADCNSWRLCQLKGCLSAACNYEDTRSDLWIMKEYGVTESWTKLISIPYISHIKDAHYSYPFPLCIHKDGKILLKVNNKVILFDPKDNSLEVKEFGAYRPVETYVESLVLLDESLQNQH